MEFTFSLKTISETVQSVWQVASRHKVWAFHGEMGAGKTTFIKNLCRFLQVSSTVASPTYSIINEYQSRLVATIYHMDWYRLSNEEEAMLAGVEETLESGHLCLVEWPEKAAGLLPDETVHLYISLKNHDERRIVIKNEG